MGRSSLRKNIKRTITSSGILLRLLRMVAGDMPRVFVWHRFTPPGVEMIGRVSADAFARQLDSIGNDLRVLSLGEMLAHYQRHGNWPRRAVVLTIDDGYRDFYTWGYPELKKRGMKATFFVTVNFIEGNLWLWPDRLQWALENTVMTEVTLRFHNETRRFHLSGIRDREVVWKICCDHCITLADDDKESFIRIFEDTLGASRPEAPTNEYRAVTWEELREIGDNNIEIGSHTMNHPILSRIESKQLIDEIYVSKSVIEKKLERRVETICYPNSGPGDITEEVIKAVKDAGYTGGVFGIDLKSWAPFTVPRMGVNNNYSDFLWKLYGGESL